MSRRPSRPDSPAQGAAPRPRPHFVVIRYVETRTIPAGHVTFTRLREWFCVVESLTVEGAKSDARGAFVTNPPESTAGATREIREVLCKPIEAEA
jgi:hypothetical protein